MLRSYLTAWVWRWGEERGLGNGVGVARGLPPRTLGPTSAPLAAHTGVSVGDTACVASRTKHGHGHTCAIVGSVVLPHGFGLPTGGLSTHHGRPEIRDRLSRVGAARRNGPPVATLRTSIDASSTDRPQLASLLLRI